jgi:hypothetical protein
MLSLLMARRPAACLTSIEDVRLFGDTLQIYLKKQIEDDMEDESLLMHKNCGAVALVRIIPMLYHLSSWGGLTPNRRKSMFNQMIVVLRNLCLIRDAVDSGHSSDARDDMVDPLYPARDGKKCALSVFAIAAVLEILGRFIAHGAHMQDRPAGFLRDANCEQEIDDIVKEYARFNLDFAFLPALLECCQNPSSSAAQIDAKRILAENENKLLLADPLLQSRMRCGLPRCRARQPQGQQDGSSSIGRSQNLPKCSGGCNGMELYCCREHQIEHWCDHKRFCRAAK